MYRIGEFASIGRVTIRLLRHYDEIDLLKPARVDPDTGYRLYGLDQVAVLGRILQLRDFGLRLDVVAEIVHGDLGVEQERELLRHCGDRLAEQIADNTVRLDRLEAYLRSTEGEVMEPTIEAELRAIEPRRVAYLTAFADGWGGQHIGPVIGPLFGKLADALARSGHREFGPGIAIYEAEESGDQTRVSVTAAVVIGDAIGADGQWQVMTLPRIELAAVTVHHGSPASIDQSWHSLMDWTRAQGYELSGVCREVYLSPDDVAQEDWVTELQQPVSALGSSGLDHRG